MGLGGNAKCSFSWTFHKPVFKYVKLAFMAWQVWWTVWDRKDLNNSYYLNGTNMELSPAGYWCENVSCQWNQRPDMDKISNSVGQHLQKCGHALTSRHHVKKVLPAWTPLGGARYFRFHSIRRSRMSYPNITVLDEIKYKPCDTFFEIRQFLLR